MMKTLFHTLFIAGIISFAARAQTGNSFSTPEEARDALIKAAAKGVDELRALFGPESQGMLRTGDEVEDKNALIRFNVLAAERSELEPDEMNPNRMTLNVGAVQWPFAVPLVRKGNHWQWDLDEGRAEVHRRTIGLNELTAIDVCRGYVEAQQSYAETDRNGNGVLQYAKKIVSTQGKKDGLYWPGEDSPVAAGFAKAAAEGYQLTSGGPKSYHGYFYKILLAQGPDAAGGEQDYVVHGLMIGGFALIAWPAEYGVSGIMTFIVNQDGVVYQKDLGPRTGTLAKAVTIFNPDKTWSVVRDEMESDESE